MTGLAIVAATLLAVVATIAVICASFAAFDKLCSIYRADGNWGLKVLFLIPVCALGIWCLFLNVVLTLLSIIGIHHAATATRDWWHKGR